MDSNEIVTDVQRIKDDLAREAGGDLSRQCQSVREWADSHPHPGPVLKDASELNDYLAEKRTRESCFVLKERPKPPGK